MNQRATPHHPNRMTNPPMKARKTTLIPLVATAVALVFLGAGCVSSDKLAQLEKENTELKAEINQRKSAVENSSVAEEEVDETTQIEAINFSVKSETLKEDHTTAEEEEKTQKDILIKIELCKADAAVRAREIQIAQCAEGFKNFKKLNDEYTEKKLAEIKNCSDVKNCLNNLAERASAGSSESTSFQVRFANMTDLLKEQMTAESDIIYRHDSDEAEFLPACLGNEMLREELTNQLYSECLGKNNN